MQKFPIDSYSNENFIYPFFRPRGPLTLKRGEDTSGTRVCPHAKFGVNRPTGCGEIVDKKQTKKHTVKQIPCPSLYQRVAGKNGFGILNFDRSTTRPQRSDRDRRGTVCSLLKVNQTTYGDITDTKQFCHFHIIDTDLDLWPFKQKSMGTVMWSNEWCHFQWSWVTRFMPAIARGHHS